MKKMTSSIAGLFVMTIAITVGCSKSNEEDMTTPTPSGCDTVNMTYSANVVPILKNNCYGCHGNGGNSGGVNLDTYDNVKIQADNGALLGSIAHTSGYTAMPLNGDKLSDCNINIIRDWINRGALNN